MRQLIAAPALCALYFLCQWNIGHATLKPQQRVPERRSVTLKLQQRVSRTRGASSFVETGETHRLRARSALGTRSALTVHMGETQQLRARSSLTLRASAMARTSKASGPPRNEFFTVLSIGKPQQQFTVALDTGSGHLMVPAKDCPDMACKAHRGFDRFLSVSARDVMRVDDETSLAVINWPPKKDADTLSLFFGSGKATGRVVNDRVCVGPPLPGQNLCSKMNFIVAESESAEPFSLLPFDGILGLGLPELSTTPKFNIMGEFAEQEMLLHDRFAMWLSLPEDGEQSEITFGDFVPERMASHIIWTAITNHAGQSVRSGFWQTEIEDVAIGNQVLGMGMHQAAIDTGTSMIAGPGSLINAIETELKIERDCANMGELPTLGFVIGGTILNMEPKDYVMKAGDECHSQFMVLDLPPPKGPLVLLGDPFLRKYYTVFDRDTLKLGFALSMHESLKEHTDLKGYIHSMMVVH